MPGVIYLLCAATCLICAFLLLRSYLANRGNRLLLWSSMCFVGLMINNIFVFVDLIVVPEVDLSVWRSLPALIGVCLLLYGLIWEVR